jgi:drug/metabolite transporter (DMT)-like permease
MWFFLAIMATFLTSILIIGIKYATTKNIDPTFILLICFSISALCALLHIIVNKINMIFNWKTILILIACGIFSYIGNLLLTKSIKIAPNPGYSQAILSTNIIIITILSYFIFKSDFDIKSIVGIIFCVTGIVLLSH